jgi:hypothetical protein
VDVPEWLMKPSKNNRDHIKLLAMIEHVQRAAERVGMDPFLSTQIHRLNSAFLQHSKETVDLGENPVVEALEKDRKKTLVLGGTVAFLILAPYLIVVRTNLLHPRPTMCWNLVSEREDKKTKACLIAVDHPYNPGNGDVSVVLSLDKSRGKEVVINANFWIADEIGNKTVDYRGEFNISRTRVYQNNFLVHDDHTEWSSWVKPMIPEDLVMPLWNSIKEKERELNYSKPLLEDRLMKIVQDVGAIAAALGSVGYTLWKFFLEG